MSGGAAVVTRRMWVVRWSARLARASLVSAIVILALAGLLAALSGRPERTGERQSSPAPDLAAESFAEGFTRAYLTWTGSERHEELVRAYASEALEPGAGLSLPVGRPQRVVWTAAVRDERVSGTRRLVTVAAETNTGLSYYVSVPVQRDRRGALAVVAYPALVGRPPVDTRTGPVDEVEVEDEQLRAVVRRAIANYLGRERTNLGADLDARAVVALPATRLRVASFDSITRVRPGHLAVELRAEGGGATWTLRYQLAVVKRERWYVRSIQTNANERRS
jgi:hypothetical protein